MTTAIAVPEDQPGFLALASDASAIAEVIRENLMGDTLTGRELDRVVMPPGGAPHWLIPTLDGEETAKTIEGIIVHVGRPRAYWNNSIEESDGNEPPDCISEDGQTGIGNPGGDCLTCPFAQWGSDPKGGSGKACKETRQLYILRPTDFLPIVVQAPPTSIQPVRQYMLRLASQGLSYYSVVTSLSIERLQNGQFHYGRMVLSKVNNVPDDLKPQLSDYISSIRPILTAGVVRSED